MNQHPRDFDAYLAAANQRAAAILNHANELARNILTTYQADAARRLGELGLGGGVDPLTFLDPYRSFDFFPNYTPDAPAPRDTSPIRTQAWVAKKPLGEITDK